MSTEQVINFFDKVKEDQKLQKEFSAIQAGLQENVGENFADNKELQKEMQDQFSEKIIALAGDAGFSFNAEALESALIKMEQQAGANQELSDDELESVAGGGGIGGVAYSVLSAGIGCAVLSLATQMINGSCAKTLGS